MNDYIKLIARQIQDKKHLVITGARGIGKTTLLNRLREQYGSESSMPGIITWNEQRKAVYMRKIGDDAFVTIGEFDPDSTSQITRMKPVPEGFNVSGVSILEDLILDPSEWVTVDEIGYLEGSCQPYLKKLDELFERKRVMAVVRKMSAKHIDDIVQRGDALVIDLDLEGE